MSRASVTTAQMKRAIRVFEESGKAVTSAVLRPDGSWELRAGTGDPDADIDSAEAEADWDRRLNIWRGSQQRPRRP